jgi:hypothetical protein
MRSIAMISRLGMSAASLLRACILWLAMTPLAVLHADPLEGALEIDSAFININDGVYQLHAQIRYPVSEEAIVALREGVSLSYDLEVEVFRDRRFWLDANILSIRLPRELSYQPVSERYVMRDPLDGDEQKSYPTVEAALQDLGRVEGWPILVASQLAVEGEYRVRVRASMRRGRLTDALRTLMFWTDDWQRESEWYSWLLPR